MATVGTSMVGRFFGFKLDLSVNDRGCILNM
ncbi:hypothetical protein [Flavobacterium sp. JP2137]